MSLREGFDVIGVRTPHPNWFVSSLGNGHTIPFGVHVGKIERNQSINECGGKLNLRIAVSSWRPHFAYPGKSPEVNCSACDFYFLLHLEDWKLGVFTWMQMAVAMALININTDKELMWHFSVWHDGLRPLLPDTESVSPSQASILQKYGVTGYILGVWHDFSIMVGPLDIQEADSMKFLLLNAGAMLAEMEKQFQNAIKRAAQLASSASEPFHPRTRRARG